MHRDLSWAELVMSVFIHFHDGIIITDRHGFIVEVNDAFCAITGYSRDEALGRNPRFLQSGAQGVEFYVALWRELQEHGVWRGEIANRRKDGHIVVELLTISAVRNSTGQTAFYVGTFSDITVIKEHQRQLERLAHFDSLTGLPNRQMLMDRMQQMLAWAERSDRPVAVCYLDLDAFKAVNDEYGHHTGDQVLIEVARRLNQELRSGDTVARLGGDEFVLLLAEPNTVDDVGGVLERILASVVRPIGDDPAATVSASIGVTMFPSDHADAETLLRHADQALYLAKKGGRAQYCMFDTAGENRLHVRQQLLAEVNAALAAGELRLHFQPKVSLKTRTVAGFEALLRWHHPVRGLLSPEHFRAALENAAMAARIDRWVLREALRQMSRWLDEGQRVSVSVNVSAYLLRLPGLQQTIRLLLDEYPEVSPGDLELEILETTLLDDLPRLGRQIEACRGYGVGFAIDDFGTGYSCLTWLKWIPVQVLKIDRSFVAGMLDYVDDRAIVNNVLSLARDFKREVVAEGVETAAHVRLLSRLGCDIVQGIGIAHPMPAAQVRTWMQRFAFDERWFPIPGEFPSLPAAS